MGSIQFIMNIMSLLCYNSYPYNQSPDAIHTTRNKKNTGKIQGVQQYRTRYQQKKRQENLPLFSMKFKKENVQLIHGEVLNEFQL